MMRFSAVAILAVAVSSSALASPPRFADDFLPKGLRLDLVHTGTDDTEAYALDAIREEPFWGGPYGHLTTQPDLGKYRVSVLDRDTDRLLYRSGFCSLFGEWQTTDEARAKRTIALEESVRFPFPKLPVRVVIASRDRTGTFRDVYSVVVDPASYRIDRDRRFRAVPVTEVELNGPPERQVDVLILADGYTAAEQVKFERDVRRFARVFYETRPFSDLRKQFSIRAIRAPSAESGTDEPRRGIWRDTGLSTSFNTFDSARYLTTVRSRDLRDLAALAPYDTLFVLVNTSRYGGGGIYGLYSVFVSDNEYDEYVFIHEFGHGFGGLGDEYYTSAVAYSDFYPSGVEPWEPNLTAMLPGRPLRWGRLIAPGVPIPTPEDRAKFLGAVGVFEGAGYAAKGLFRPSMDCRMFSKGNQDFCTVCRTWIEEMVRSLVDAD